MTTRTLATVTPIGAVLALSAAAAWSETSTHFPPFCKPVGAFYTCSSAQATAYGYVAPLCTSDPTRSTEGGAQSDLYNGFYRPTNCSTTVTASGGWLSGGPYSIQ